jgi:PAS domain S-box-containing protein
MDEEFHRYQQLFRRIPGLAAAIDEEGRFQELSDALLQRLGFDRDELVGRRPVDIATEDSAARIEREMVPQMRRTGRVDNMLVDFTDKAGDVVPLFTSAIVEFDPAGRYIRTIAVYTECGDVARVERRYRDLYRATPAMLHTVDARGRLTAVSNHWLDKLGYRREEVLGRSILDFMPEAFRASLGGQSKLEALIRMGELRNQDRQMVTRDGTVLDLIMSSTSERDGRGRVQQMIVASKDVTERNRAEQALRETLAENARLRQELEAERDYLREEVKVSLRFGEIVGSSPELNAMVARIEAVADTPASVLILGESGVGKELVARELHARSPRAREALVKVNCASIPKELFESEFFGHVKGAFTGAHRDRTGRFQLADGGTIFLDEIGEIPLELQGKLLRVLQENAFERVGEDRTRTVDVRVIAATNRDLQREVEEGRFREDLFYRLSVFPLEVPPLRDRGDDVLELAQHFLDIASREFARPGLSLTPRHLDLLRAYDWPGNVRELKNVIERAVILSRGSALRLDLSVPGAAAAEPAGEAPSGDFRPGSDLEVLTEEQMRELQRRNIANALRRTGWRVSGPDGAARLLNVRPTTLADRIKSFGLKKPD